MTWLTVNEASKLLAVSTSTIRKSYKTQYEYRYISGKGQGGRQIQIALESLPQAAQMRYYGENPEPQDEEYMSLSSRRRAETDSKLLIVSEYMKFKDIYPAPDKLRAFLEKYNAENPDKTITKRQLNYWQSQYKKQGIAGLIDRRGRWNKGKSVKRNRGE